MNDRIFMGENKERIQNCPNIVTLCVDSYDFRRQDGRIYHRYTDCPISFSSLFDALGQMDAFFDDLQLPWPSTILRSFSAGRRTEHHTGGKCRALPGISEKRKEMKEMESFDQVIGHRGKDATFVIRVQHRQHSSWQGEVTWVDGQKKEYFRSALELVRLIDGVLNDAEDDGA